jgi:hypothetical protein
MKTSARHAPKERRMWPSEATATWLFDFANFGLIGGLVIGAISTVLVVWMGNVKEAYLKKDMAETIERAAKANESAATANRRAAELNSQVEVEKAERLKLEAAIAPRRLTSSQKEIISRELKKIGGRFGIAVFGSPDYEETRDFRDDFITLLTASGVPASNLGRPQEDAVGLQIKFNKKNARAVSFYQTLLQAGLEITVLTDEMELPPFPGREDKALGIPAPGPREDVQLIIGPKSRIR